MDDEIWIFTTLTCTSDPGVNTSRFDKNRMMVLTRCLLISWDTVSISQRRAGRRSWLGETARMFEAKQADPQWQLNVHRYYFLLFLRPYGPFGWLNVWRRRSFSPFIVGKAWQVRYRNWQGAQWERNATEMLCTRRPPLIQWLWRWAGHERMCSESLVGHLLTSWIHKYPESGLRGPLSWGSKIAPKCYQRLAIVSQDCEAWSPDEISAFSCFCLSPRPEVPGVSVQLIPYFQTNAGFF